MEGDQIWGRPPVRGGAFWLNGSSLKLDDAEMSAAAPNPRSRWEEDSEAWLESGGEDSLTQVTEALQNERTRGVGHPGYCRLQKLTR